MAGRLTDKQKKKIIADYVKCQSYREVARKHGVAANTIKNIVTAQPDVAQKCTEKEEQNTQDTLEYMQQQSELKKELLSDILKAMADKAKKPDMFTNIKDLATAYGIIIDKEFKYIEAKSLLPSADKPQDDPLSASLKKLAGEIDDGSV